MPTNKRESMVFTIIMCAFMVFFMTLYNTARIHGVSSNLLATAWLGFPLAYAIAIIGDLFIVAPTAKKIALKIVGYDAPLWKKKIAIPTCMVCGMVLIMSLFGAVMGVGLSFQTLIVWLYNIPSNFVVALPLQLLLAGPFVRFIFRKAFPEGAIVK